MVNNIPLPIKFLVSLLTGIISCGKNSVYKKKDYAFRLVQSAVHKLSFEAVYKLTQYLSADRVLDKLQRVTEEQVFSLIRDGTRKIKLPKCVDLAADFTDKPYYGSKNHPEVMGSKGGKYVRRYLQISTVKPAFFLDVLPVNQLTNFKELLLKNLLESFNRRFPKTRIKTLLLDRGFFSKKVVSLLVEKKISFIMPAVKDRAIKKLAEQFGDGTLKKSSTGYEFGSVTIRLLFLKIEDKVIVYMTNTHKTPLQVHKKYSKRWQIETNFREQNNFTLQTKTNNFTIRYLAFAIAGLLFNLWQQTKKTVNYTLESYVFKQELLNEVLNLWQSISKKEVVKTVNYFLVT